MDFYFYAVVLLFILAISDLIVGVSNDAVNFLNSAIGSRVASRRTIMIIVSFGILVGVTFSSGMMEVARKGIFNPQYYFYNEVMIIFLAVMLTDIFLLDLFNTFGMPTSTTVSIVFELLGAAVAVGILKIIHNHEDVAELSNYINSENAIKIISSILLSVGIAFVVGAIIQFISRLLFSFNYKKRLKHIGILWSGIAFTLMTYFLLFKGFKGASFISDNTVVWINENIYQLLGISFVIWTALLAVMYYAFKIDILRLVVLFGTFSLAMAFAGNDLVNFIGVPLAGFSAYNTWMASGLTPNELSMESLTLPVRANTYMLLGAGFIMIITLWFSKKARSVTETEVNLGRQHEGTERFSPNLLSRGIVKYALVLGRTFQFIIPNRILNATEAQFEALQNVDESEEDKPAFDMVRASVNLTVASMLIAIATSFKLPLSTTYVSFMVAMGSSLADRAWGRDSAVYRVAGVLGVIGGWFATAFIAFIVAGFVAFMIYSFGWIALVIMLAILLGFIIRTFLWHKGEKNIETDPDGSEFNDKDYIFTSSTLSELQKSISLVSRIYSDALNAVINEDSTHIKRAKKLNRRMNHHHEEFRRKMYNTLRSKETDQDTSKLYLASFDLNQDLLQSIKLILEACDTQVTNYLKPVSEIQKNGLQTLKAKMIEYFSLVERTLASGDLDNISGIDSEKVKVLKSLESEITRQIEGIKKERYGMRNSMLIFSLELETNDLIDTISKCLNIFKRDDNNPSKVVEIL